MQFVMNNVKVSEITQVAMQNLIFYDSSIFIGLSLGWSETCNRDFWYMYTYVMNILSCGVDQAWISFRWVKQIYLNMCFNESPNAEIPFIFVYLLFMC